jgi:hypothetical protein
MVVLICRCAFAIQLAQGTLTQSQRRLPLPDPPFFLPRPNFDKKPFLESLSRSLCASFGEFEPPSDI